MDGGSYLVSSTSSQEHTLVGSSVLSQNLQMFLKDSTTSQFQKLRDALISWLRGLKTGSVEAKALRPSVISEFLIFAAL